ncbi:hypothetical protein SASPL_133121 [Salvia splendens]|uniref:Uncharacterized protein n=1 Tax=Salvia splendens TaxID=180675 RepID=A0A8X8X248_SALSN|nr:hypothetical protein SASPL_133121 [Salvia splendens]
MRSLRFIFLTILSLFLTAAALELQGHMDLAQLAKVSIIVSQSRSKFISAYVENLTRQAQLEPEYAGLGEADAAAVGDRGGAALPVGQREHMDELRGRL